MDYILIENLKVFAHHGVFPEETKNGQDFYITAKLYLDTLPAAVTDELSLSVNYGEVCHDITRLMQEKTFQLIESAAHYVTDALLKKYSLISKISLRLNKPNAPVGLPFENISINIEKSWHTAYLSIGSNMGDRKKYLTDAIEALKSDENCCDIKISEFIETEPYGYTNQNSFLNAAIGLKTLYSPYQLLDLLHKLETAAKRERIIHWGPRTLDLDILLYDDLITTDELLTIPHPDMHNRDFVLLPLKEIAPNVIHPLLQKRICHIK